MEEQHLGLSYVSMMMAFEQRCTNGGKANLTNGFCDCPPFFAGNRCEMIKCANGGINLPDSNGCECGLRYTGEFCEFDRLRDTRIQVGGIVILLLISILMYLFYRKNYSTRNDSEKGLNSLSMNQKDIDVGRSDEHISDPSLDDLVEIIEEEMEMNLNVKMSELRLSPEFLIIDEEKQEKESLISLLMVD